MGVAWISIASLDKQNVLGSRAHLGFFVKAFVVIFGLVMASLLIAVLNGESLIFGWLYLGGFLFFQVLFGFTVFYWGSRAITFLRQREGEGSITTSQVDLMARSMFRAKVLVIVAIVYVLSLVPAAFYCPVEQGNVNTSGWDNSTGCLMYSFVATVLVMYLLDLLIALFAYRYFVAVSMGAAEASNRPSAPSRLVSWVGNPLRSATSKDDSVGARSTGHLSLATPKNKKASSLKGGSDLGPRESKRAVDFTIMDMSNF